MVEKYGLTHLSTGDLLRNEIESAGAKAETLKKMMQNVVDLMIALRQSKTIETYETASTPVIDYYDQKENFFRCE
ncbi:hypothetical protein LOAG_14551 [Loa loa]|uniref:Uncharacterized protein n=1 Tax=Loa loa TaxID=7209 RepID=A0A1S0TI25_LOALO|nr:hypothetical protein LOAG_14551 [Loa loa]EFO13976.2 hypothetical protein LOAG_14551 [Loa loa]